MRSASQHTNTNQLKKKNRQSTNTNHQTNSIVHEHKPGNKRDQEYKPADKIDSARTQTIKQNCTNTDQQTKWTDHDTPRILSK